MKKKSKFPLFLLAVLAIVLLLAAPAFALEESEVTEAVNDVGKEGVTGNVMIWFMCAVAFLKVSQKVDSFLASMGVNVGHAGGAMLGDAMVAIRTITMLAGGKGSPGGGGKPSGGTSGAPGADGSSGFLKGGLAGVVSRSVKNEAVKTATTRTQAATANTSRMDKVSRSASASQVHTASQAQADSASQVVDTSHTASSTQSEHSVSEAVHSSEIQPAIPIGNNTSGGESSAAVPVAFDMQPAMTHPSDTAAPIEPPPVPPVPPGVDDQSISTQQMVSEYQGITERNAESGQQSHTDSVSSVNQDTYSSQQAITGQQTVISQQSSVDQQSIIDQQAAVERHSATDQHTVTSQQSQSNQHSDAEHSSEKQRTIHTSTVERTVSRISELRQGGIGGTIFMNSLRSGGQFANEIISKVALGDIRSTGSIRGEMAAQSLLSYTGITALGEQARGTVSYSDVEIGGGRITGTETTAEHPEGISFAMYHAGKYTAPEDGFRKIHTADGEMWYKQYAVDTVVKKPFKGPDGEVDYKKDIVKKLPKGPQRKDRL